jgi:ABC-2 type transport system ATP-binding protein
MNDWPSSDRAEEHKLPRIAPAPRRPGNGEAVIGSTGAAPTGAAPTEDGPIEEIRLEVLPDPSLEIRDLCRYFGRLRAVSHVSFAAYPGQVMGFIGPNGAGKTTTMRILATLETPTSGDAFIGGFSVIDDPDKARAIFGFMPDSFGKYDNMDVVEYLDFFARAYGFSGARRKDAIERVLVFTELRKLAHKPIKTLSKGMSQRLGLGRTLIHDPQVLILDEPAAGLDPRARVELRELIGLLARELNKTVLISSHILTELGEICNSAAIIEAGRILASGTIDEIRKLQRQKLRGHAQSETIVCRVIARGEDLERWLLEQPFIEEVKRVDQILTFDFQGSAAEQAKLLKRMILEEFEVLEFQSKAESLEDAFMAITEGITQ